MEIESIETTFSQEADTCKDGDMENYITIRCECDFLIIQTERWSLDYDEIDGFAETLKKLLKSTLKK